MFDNSTVRDTQRVGLRRLASGRIELSRGDAVLRLDAVQYAVLVDLIHRDLLGLALGHVYPSERTAGETAPCAGDTGGWPEPQPDGSV